MQIILNDLKGLTNGSVASIIQKFSGSIPGYNWQLVNTSLPNNENAGTATKINSQGYITTQFDAAKFGNSTDLSVARTILHESVHAYVVAVTYNTLTDPVKRQQLLGPDWLTVAINYGHDYMASNYISPLASALEEYGNNFLGYNLPTQFYQDLAWGGLMDRAKLDSSGNVVKDSQGNTVYEEMPVFKSLIPNVNDRNRVRNVVNIELGATGNAQSGRNSGC